MTTPPTRPLAVLVGAPGAGKSTVGALLANRLDVAFLDVDHAIEATAGKPISDIFIEDGEEAFRALEVDAVARALESHPGVLALGGGAVLSPDTRTRLHGHRVVYLRVGLAAAAHRTGLSTARPLLAVNPRATLRHLLEQRTPWYEEVATITVDTDDRTPEEVTADVADHLAGQIQEAGR